MKKKKILAVTGIRSEYDILYPVLQELRNSNFDVKIVVSGAHLSDHFGKTIDQFFSEALGKNLDLRTRMVANAWAKDLLEEK